MCGFASESIGCVLGIVSLALGSIDIDQAVSAITHMTAAKAIVRMNLTSMANPAPAAMV